MKKHWIVIVISVFLFSSCEKDEVIPSGELTGKWLFVESYHGYLNGGSFAWQPILMKDSHYLEFLLDVKYIKQENSNGAFQKCTGTFNLLQDNALEVYGDCQTVPERGKISELTSKTLIIDYQGREGVVRNKYEAVNKSFQFSD